MPNFIFKIRNAKLQLTLWRLCFILGFVMFFLVLFWSPLSSFSERQVWRLISNPKVNRTYVKLDSRSTIPFPTTNFTGLEEKNGSEFWEGLKPSFKCPEWSLTRVGHPFPGKDGDKWMCGVAPLHGRACKVYSFGVASDSYFEAELLNQTPCSIFAYDPSVSQIGNPLRGEETPRLKFSKIGVGHSNENGAGNKWTIKTIKTLMEENGHDWIDILKMDVEGAENVTIYKFLDDSSGLKILPVGQLLVELHDASYGIVQPLIRALERKGLRLFHLEINQWAPECCAELSFLNVAARFLEESENLELFY